MFPLYMDISTKYSGMGTVLIHAECLPKNKTHAFLSYLRMSFHVIISDVALEERICLAFAKEGTQFFKTCLQNDIPVASFDGLEIRLPNIWAFVYLPSFVAMECDFDNFCMVKEKKVDICEMLETKLYVKDYVSVIESSSNNSLKYDPTHSSELDLVLKPKDMQKPHKRKKQKYVHHIKTVADSLADVHADKPKQTVHKNLSKKQKEIIEQNQKRIDEEKKNKEALHLKELFQRYKTGDIQARKKIVDTESGSLNIRIKILLLRIEFYFSEWKLELRKEEVNRSVMLPVYLACLELIKLKFEEKSIKFGEEIQRNEKDIANNKIMGSDDRDWRADDELSFAFSNLIDLGFASTVKEIVLKYKIEYDNSALDKVSGKPNDSDIYFQLKYAGDRLTRTLGSKVDSRVSFIPDSWQIKLLDAVDASKSAVVCAPTSCGKTFICYYAIEKVLQQSESDVVVFCVPTKALVNQVMADVYARFVNSHCRKKKVLQGILMRDYQVDAFNCQVLITTPYMLETLLSTLQKMPKDITKKKKPAPVVTKKTKEKQNEYLIENESLIDSIKRHKFTLDSIKYIIIDEVHKIGSEEMGVSIERVVHMAPCPLLLLSATLGNLQSFYNWMDRIEKGRGRVCELIVHNERYCELKPYVYNREMSEDGDLAGKISSINPLIAFSYTQIRKSGFSSDISFLPEELLDIYYAFYASVINKKLAKQLRPKDFFKSNIVKKQDVKNYEIFLIKKLEDWIKTEVVSEDEIKEMYDLLVRNTNEAFLNEVRNEMGNKELNLLKTSEVNNQVPEKKEIHSRGNDDVKFEEDEINQSAYGNNKFEEGKINQSAKGNNKFEQDKINQSANGNNKFEQGKINQSANGNIKFNSDVNHLLDEDNNSLENTDDFKIPDSSLFTPEYLHNNITNLILLLKEQDLLPCIVFNSDRNICNSLAKRLYNDLEEMERNSNIEIDNKRKDKILKESKRLRDKEKKSNAWIEETIVNEENHSMMIDEKKKSHCLFTRLFRKSDYELKELLQGINNTDSSLIDMIYRGIGVHHNGINKKYRLSVETLFRAKHIAAVFSTETLSLGINMPCRTVIFAGDSLMSVVSYKQMAGRAGRRGFDTLGNVIFYGMGKRDVMNLISSRMGVIRGINGFIPGSILVGNKEAAESMIKNSLFTLMYEDSGTNTFNGNNIEIKTREQNIIDIVNEINATPVVSDPHNQSDFYCMEKNRRCLFDKQKEFLTSLKIIPHSRLTDLFYANKETDPDIFIMIYLLSNNAISSDPYELITTLAHIFEVKYTRTSKILPPLPPLTNQHLQTLFLYFKGHEPEFLKLGIFRSYDNRFKNSYLLDFMEHGRVEVIMKENGIDAGELWQSCSVIQDVMVSMMKIWNVTKEVKNCFSIFMTKFGKIQA